MKQLFRILVPVAILAVTILTVRWMMLNRPEPQMRRPPTAITAVDATRIKPTSYQVRIPSQGVVQPRTQSTLIPQVSGRIISISPSFRDGGFFEKDETLLTIDPSDYETAVVAAEATLAQRESALELEKAQHEQAVENWQLLGKGAKPNPLTLREPQLAEAKANVDSAQARVVEAQRNLQRTTIKAPYAGRVLRKQVDVGQTVSPGNQLAVLFAVDYVEVRLPILNEHLDFLDLPENYRGELPTSERQHLKVTLKGTHGSKEVTWQGEIVRAEGAFDPDSRQLFVVAQVDDPYSRTDADQPPLKVNQFVEAKIFGTALDEIFIIPRSAVRDAKEVLLINQENQIQRTPVSALWRDANNIVVRENLKAGDVLCLTPMTFAVNGAEVLPTIDGVAPKRPNAPGGPGGRRGPGGKPGDGKPAKGKPEKS
jgi:membrane fusion protein, multidrug efflux system